MTDEGAFLELTRRARAGDEDAAAAIVREFEPELRRRLRVWMRFRDSRLRRAFDSADIFQSVMASFFFRVAAGQFELSAPEDLPKLLIAMARRKLAHVARSHQAEKRDVRMTQGMTLGDDFLGATPTPSRIVSAKEMLAAARNRMTSDERALSELRSEGLAWHEIATRVGDSPDACRKRLARAVDRIAAELGLDPQDDE